MTVSDRRGTSRSSESRAPLSVLPENEQLRLVTRVAWLYHVRSFKQSEVAEELGLSQSRVSRLLDLAVDLGIVKTTVRIPPGLHLELEQNLRDAYGLVDVQVFDAPPGTDENLLLRDLGQVLAGYLFDNPLTGDIIGFTSWSRTLRETVRVLEVANPTGAKYVVELFGDVGPPDAQHEAAELTRLLAGMTGGQPRFLRVPGVVSDPKARAAILNHDSHARETLGLLDHVDEALVAIGTLSVDAPLQPGENFFTLEQLERVRHLGAIGQVNLRFIDEDGNLIETELDEMVIGVRAEQLRSYPRSIAAAGGASKHAVVRGALAGGWVNTLVTDTETAAYLLKNAPA